MHYTVDPGLYAVGDPDERSPVLVTANYKMSFDMLRGALPGRDIWVLVLDTKGINVWCAAGKGTFGTAELVARIASSGLERVVSHRKLILPQLAGPGVAAHHVKTLAGFTVIYGPIRARDLPAFLDGDLKATPEMRRKTFTMLERAVLIPVDFVSALKWFIVILPLLLFLGGLGGSGRFWAHAFDHGLLAVMVFLAAICAGTVFTPLLLPWLPGRAFALKGMNLGLGVAVCLVALRWGPALSMADRLEMLALLFLLVAITAYLAMNFTGASTYTSLSGVRKEMRWALPLELGGCIVGLMLWLISRFIV